MVKKPINEGSAKTQFKKGHKNAPEIEAKRLEVIAGNKYNLKLKEPEIRQLAYQQYCKHIEDGWPKQAWCFDHPTVQITWETMDKYIKESPHEFDPYLKKRAESQRFKHWMEHGNCLMRGKYLHGSPETWKTIMRNMFKDIKWDRQELEEAPAPTEPMKIIIAGIDNARAALQPETDRKLSESEI